MGSSSVSLKSWNVLPLVISENDGAVPDSLLVLAARKLQAKIQDRPSQICYVLWLSD